jgi:outer membrane protein OmpA-like peptidoglycan-associated protein
MIKKTQLFFVLLILSLSLINISCSSIKSLENTKPRSIVDPSVRSDKRQKEVEEMQKQFQWWPTDAQPAPVADPRGGFWWWPEQPGQARPWGNRGFVFLYKIIYDYKAEEEEVKPAPVEQPAKPELKPSLLIKKIIKNVKIYFDYNKADLRDDHKAILDKAIKTLGRNPEASILITGNCDTRGSDEYNLKLGKKRGDSVKQYMLDGGIPEDRIKIVSRGKLDAVAPINDLEGMQKDRNAQFVIAEVEEMMLPEPPTSDAQKIDEGKYIQETQEAVESAPKVSTKEYVIQKNDNLSSIAQREMGKASRWKYLYEFNKDRIKDPNKLKAGQTILIPIE